LEVSVRLELLSKEKDEFLYLKDALSKVGFTQTRRRAPRQAFAPAVIL
jgi:hypothetical protein